MNDFPYASQWDPDANKRNSDCGQTCVKMVAESYGIHVKTNSLPYQSAPNGLTTANQIIQNLRFVGLDGKFSRYHTIDLKTGDICLITYGKISPEHKQDQHFKGLHWLVFLGLDDTGDHVEVNDPNFYGTRRDEGKSHFLDRGEWESSFTGQTIRAERTQSNGVAGQTK